VRWWLVPVSSVLIIALFGAVYYPVARVQYRETRERAKLEAERDALIARNDRLRREVERLRTPEGVEDHARTQLGLVRDGERVVVVRDANGEMLSAPAPVVGEIDSARVREQAVGPWTALLDLAFGLR
jgi:cell division protein FtsL